MFSGVGCLASTFTPTDRTPSSGLATTASNTGRTAAGSISNSRATATAATADSASPASVWSSLIASGPACWRSRVAATRRVTVERAVASAVSRTRRTSAPLGRMATNPRAASNRNAGGASGDRARSASIGAASSSRTVASPRIARVRSRSNLGRAAVSRPSHTSRAGRWFHPASAGSTSSRNGADSLRLRANRATADSFASRAMRAFAVASAAAWGSFSCSRLRVNFGTVAVKPGIPRSQARATARAARAWVSGSSARSRAASHRSSRPGGKVRTTSAVGKGGSRYMGESTASGTGGAAAASDAASSRTSGG